MTKRRPSSTDYSRIADYYDQVRPMTTYVYLSAIIEYGGIRTDCTVLDIGCGTGRFPLSILSRRTPMVCALEPSIEMLRKAVAKDSDRRILWVQGDAQSLPFRDNFFDCVYMTLVIHHIDDKEIALSEIYRTLKKGGKCVIMTNSHARMRRHILHLFPGLTAIDLRRFPSIPVLKRIMMRIGFGHVRYHIIEHDEGYVSTDEYLKRVKSKYVSTLTLLSEEAFRTGLDIFQQRVRREYGDRIRQISSFVFVVGKK